jgi:hypothetical protein
MLGKVLTNSIIFLFLDRQDGELSERLWDLISILWRDSGVRQVFERSHQFHLSDSAGFQLGD